MAFTILKKTLRSISHRYYISDTEVNHIAHNLALKSATHIIIPSHWDESLDGGFMQQAQAKGIKIHRLDGSTWPCSPKSWNSRK